MSEWLTYGSVRGAARQGGPYRDCSCSSSIVAPPLVTSLCQGWGLAWARRGSSQVRSSATVEYEYEYRFTEYEYDLGVRFGGTSTTTDNLSPYSTAA